MWQYRLHLNTSVGAQNSFSCDTDTLCVQILSTFNMTTCGDIAFQEYNFMKSPPVALGIVVSVLATGP
jgi:hypothetical protein